MTAVQPADPSAPSVPPKMMTSLRVGDDSIEVINQLLLPHEIQWDSCDSVEDAYDAIKSMRVSCTGPLLRLSTRLIRHSSRFEALRPSHHSPLLPCPSCSRDDSNHRNPSFHPTLPRHIDSNPSQPRAPFLNGFTKSSTTCSRPVRQRSTSLKP